jgi:copper chaperone CopZ
MKLLLVLPLVLAGAVLGWIALSAEEPTYEPPVPGVADVVPTSLSGDVPVGMVVRRFRVTGMCCDGCSGKLYRSLAAVDGVREAAVDFRSATAQAVVPAGADDASLLASLRFDKYAAEPE